MTILKLLTKSDKCAKVWDDLVSLELALTNPAYTEVKYTSALKRNTFGTVGEYLYKYDNALRQIYFDVLKRANIDEDTEVNDDLLSTMLDICYEMSGTANSVQKIYHLPNNDAQKENKIIAWFKYAFKGEK